MTAADKALEQLDLLIGEYDRLKARSKHKDLSDLKPEAPKLATRLEAALDRLTSPESAYAKSVDSVRARAWHLKLPELRAVAEAGLAQRTHVDVIAEFRLAAWSDVVARFSNEPQLHSRWTGLCAERDAVFLIDWWQLPHSGTQISELSSPMQHSTIISLISSSDQADRIHNTPRPAAGHLSWLMRHFQDGRNLHSTPCWE
jgi:hypothetical protein